MLGRRLRGSGSQGFIARAARLENHIADQLRLSRRSSEQLTKETVQGNHKLQRLLESEALEVGLCLRRMDASIKSNVPPLTRVVSESLMSKLDEKSLKLIREKNFAFLATIDSSGSPQVTPIWIDSDGDHVLLNTAIGRVKQKNTKRNPRIAVAVLDMSNPYRYAAIKGRVAEQIVGQTAEEHIDKLAKKYLGKDKYPFRQAGEKRVILKIVPEHVTPPE